MLRFGIFRRSKSVFQRTAGEEALTLKQPAIRTLCPYPGGPSGGLVAACSLGGHPIPSDSFPRTPGGASKPRDFLGTLLSVSTTCPGLHWLLCSFPELMLAPGWGLDGGPGDTPPESLQLYSIPASEWTGNVDARILVQEGLWKCRQECH